METFHERNSSLLHKWCDCTYHLETFFVSRGRTSSNVAVNDLGVVLWVPDFTVSSVPWSYSYLLTQIDYQLFLQQRSAYSGSAENWNSGSAPMASHMQVPTQKGKETAFIREKGTLEGYSKQRVYGFLLAESLPGKGVFLLPVRLCYQHRIWELPLRSPSSNWGFFQFINFLHFPLLIKIFLWKYHFQFHHFHLLFPPQYQEGPFLGVVSHFEGKCRFKTCQSHMNNKKR